MPRERVLHINGQAEEKYESKSIEVVARTLQLGWRSWPPKRDEVRLTDSRRLSQIYIFGRRCDQARTILLRETLMVLMICDKLTNS